MDKPSEEIMSSILKHKACIACHYYCKKTSKFGECRKQSPSVDRDGITNWPRVEDSDWCGDFDYDFKNMEINIDG